MQARPCDAPSGATSITSGVVASVIAKLLYLATRFALPPVVLAYIGLDDYGLWATCFLVVAYLGTGTFGVTFVYVRWVAIHAARGDTAAIQRLASTGVTIVALINFALFAALWFGLPRVMEMLAVDPARRDLAQTLIASSTGIFLMEQVFGVYTGILEGLQRLKTTNTIWTGANLVECALVVLLLVGGYGVYALPAAYGARAVVAILLARRACRAALPDLRLRPGRIDRASLRAFVGFGGLSQLSGLLSMALRSAEKVLAGSFLGTGATALYELGEKLPMMATWLPAGVGVAIFPAGSRLAAADHTDALRRLYLDSARALAVVTALLVAPLLVLAQPLLEAWLGSDPRLAPAATILAVFTIPYHANTVTASASTIFRARGEPARELVYSVAQALLLGVFGWFAFARFGAGLTAINLAVGGAMVVSAALYLAYANHRLGVAQHTFLGEVVLPAAVPYVLAGVAAHWTGASVVELGGDRLAALQVVCGTGVVYAGLLLVAGPTLLLKAHERQALLRRVTVALAPRVAAH